MGASVWVGGYGCMFVWVHVCVFVCICVGEGVGVGPLYYCV